MKEAKNDPLLLEIQEEINRENINQFFNKYGSFLIAAALAIIIGIGGYKAYKSQHDEQSAKTGSAVYSVLKDDSSDEFTLKKLDNAAKTRGYKEIAMLNKAQAQIDNDDIAGAMVSFDAVINDNSSDKALKDLAALNAVNLLLNTDPKNKQLESRITALTADDNTFKYSAMELLAAYYMQNNQPQKASPIFQKLSSDANVPVTISKRARELAPPMENKASSGEEE